MRHVVLRRLALASSLAAVVAFACLASAESKPSPEKPAQDPPKQWANASALDREACLAALKAMKESGAKLTVHPPQTKPNKLGCGMPQPVTVTKGPTGIVHSPPLVIDCSLAQELPKIEAILQEEARAELGAELRKVQNLGSYACRKSNGPATRAWAGRAVMSEHAFGLAIDMNAFGPAKGRAVTVLKDWGKDDGRGRFLSHLRRRLKAETAVTHVVTPDYNAAHRDHLHVDRGLPWGWWWD